MTTITSRQAKFRANVPDLEKRLEAERLWRTYDAAYDALHDALEGEEFGEDEIPDEREDLKALKGASDAAYQVWNDCDCESLDFEGDSNEPKRCALTGLLIHEDDFHLVDRNTGEYVLKSALGVAINEAGEFEIARAAAGSPQDESPRASKGEAA